MKQFYTSILVLVFGIVMHAQQSDQLTVMSYNLLNYRSSTSYCPFTQNNPLTKEGHLKTVAQYVNPDILVCVEIGDSPTNADFILANSLNTNGANTYQKAAYSNNGFSSLVNMLFYNSTKLSLYSQHAVTKDLNNNDLVRVIDVYRLYYKDSLLTAQSDTVFFTVAAAHLKAGNTGSDITDRAAAAEALMDYIYKKVPDDNVMLCGDLNIYKSQETAYQYLTQGTPASNRLYDPLNQPGNWSSNSSFAILHTQSTRNTSTNGGCFSSGGLDDRLDHILISDEIRDNVDGMRYIPNTYFALGNDGLHYNKSITDGTNNSVPANILTALYELSDHLPVIAEFEVKRQQIGLDENQRLASQIFYTNPVNDIFTLDLKMSTAKMPVARIFSMTGAEIKAGNMQQNGPLWQFQCNLAHCAKGIYFVEITTANGLRAIKKLVKL